MKLSLLLQDCVAPWERRVAPAVDPEADPEIRSIHSRAQDVKPEGLFIAVKGFSADGHDFIDTAFANGAAAVIAEKDGYADKRIVQVKNTRKSMAAIAARFFGNPSEQLFLNGITGTNGKTTVTWLTESIFKAAGFNTGVIGTINVRYNGSTYETPVTTPDSPELQRILADMVQSGVTHVIMEVSSHAVDLSRIDHCSFNTGVFTNLSQDHLDYHNTMKAYWRCKKDFFTKILQPRNSKNPGCAVINTDDVKGKELAARLAPPVLTTGLDSDADITCRDITDNISGIAATLVVGDTSVKIGSPLTGRFNIENILSAAGAARAAGISPDAIKKGIEACTAIPGRLERIDNTQDRFVFVDYAHTPDALASILEILSNRAENRLITVFGCGGDRDPSKRPLMAKAASKQSDIVIVTSDNPRSEDPEKIIDEILPGIDNSIEKENVIVEPDRAKALDLAVRISKEKDTIVAAGKGHETYQIIKSGRIDFDDRRILQQALEKMAEDAGKVADGAH